MSHSQSGHFFISDETSLLNLLEKAVLGEEPIQQSNLSISDHDWLGVRILYNGPKFNQSLTSNVMQGMIGFQNSVYRMAALIIKDDPRITLLSDAQKENMELVFKIGPGSSSIFADVAQSFSSLLEIIKPMSDNKKLILLLTTILLIGGSGAAYFLKGQQNAHEIEKLKINQTSIAIQSQASALEKAISSMDRTTQLLLEAQKKNPQVLQIIEHSQSAIESVIRHSGDVVTLDIQGIRFGREEIDRIRINPRRTSENIELRGEFEILSVDATSPEGFLVKIRSPEEGYAFSATVYDGVSSQSIRNAIGRAEWNKTRVRLHVTGRRLGDQILDARILSARNIKSQIDRVNKSK